MQAWGVNTAALLWTGFETTSKMNLRDKTAVQEEECKTVSVNSLKLFFSMFMWLFALRVSAAKMTNTQEKHMTDTNTGGNVQAYVHVYVLDLKPLTIK